MENSKTADDKLRFLDKAHNKDDKTVKIEIPKHWVMETRQVTQIKIYKLFLEPILEKEESKCLVAISFSKEELFNWYESQKAEEPYKGFCPDQLEMIAKEGVEKDDLFPFEKTFKIGSAIEWYESIGTLSTKIHTDKSIKYVGVYEVWMTVEEIQEEFIYIMSKIKKDKITIGEYLGYVTISSFQSIPIPQLVGLTPDFLSELNTSSWQKKNG